MTKITGLTALSTIAAGDLFEVTDIDDTTDDAAGSSKKVKAEDIPRSNMGTAFPVTGLYDGYPFHRTNIGVGMRCFYDLTNTQWVSEQSFDAAPPVATLSATGGINIARSRDDYAHYDEKVNFTSFVATTNDGSHYWTISVRSYNATLGSYTEILSFDTSGDSADTYVDHDSAPSTPAPTYYGMYKIYATKVGSPGNMTAWASINYRLIVT
ncbi:MAG: hypothetical protein ACYS32_16505 [Planctomycetota bacterium]|jgi:hypothetical protein